MVSKERVQLLVDALRSGEFVQGRDVLEATHADGKIEHCCLGVACRVAMANGVHVKLKQTTLTGGVVATIFNRGACLPPAVVQAWYGFEAADPRLRIVAGEVPFHLQPFEEADGDDYAGEEEGFIRASTLNDRAGASFNTIADAFARTFLEQESTDGQ